MIPADQLASLDQSILWSYRPISAGVALMRLNWTNVLYVPTVDVTKAILKSGTESQRLHFFLLSDNVT